MSSQRFSPFLLLVFGILSAANPPQGCGVESEMTQVGQDTKAEAAKREVTQGSLRIVGEDGSIVECPLKHTDVKAEVSGFIARVNVTQTFHNPKKGAIEAVYVFPLPERAAVHRMEILIGNRRIVSVIQERKQARKTYERAKSAGKKTALVEQERPNLFTTSVANINPGETVSVLLEYVEEVEYRDGVFSLAFPLTFTPRYTSPKR